MIFFKKSIEEKGNGNNYRCIGDWISAKLTYDVNESDEEETAEENGQ